jgi:uncharacterized RDD family membrane protein YckC
MIRKRILAYCIDYFVIIIYAIILFSISYAIHEISEKPLEPLHPITGNLFSFFSLTVPVFLYFFFYESSSKKGTLGKQLLNLKVENNKKKNIFIRVLFKIIPWEIAHFGIHWSVFYSRQEVEIPLWNWIINILPQIIIIIYFITIVLSKGKSSIYDKTSRTRIESFK